MRRALAFTLFACACSEPGRDLRVDLPITPADRAAIIAAWIPDDVSSAIVHAVAIDESGTIDPLAVPFEVSRGLAISAFLYTESLDELFLDAGPIARLPDGAAERPLPATTRIYHTLAGGEWSMLAEAPAPLASARVPALEDCVEFSAARYSLPSNNDALFALGLALPNPPDGFSGNGALVGTEGRKIYYVESSTVVELQPTVAGICGPDVSGRPQFYAAYQDPRGELWLVSRCGEIHKAALDLSGRRLSGRPEEAAPHRDSLIAIAGPPSGEARSLFVLSTEGELDELDLRASLATMLTTLGGEDGEGAIAYAGDGEAVLAWSPTRDLVRARGGQISTEPLPSEVEGATPLRVARGGQLGLVAGNTAGEIFYRRSDRWRRLADPLDGRIEAVTPYRDSALILDGGGRLRLYSARRRAFCEALDVNPGLSDRALHVAAVNGPVLVAGEGGTYLWLEPR